MSSLNNLDNFAGRVNFAAFIITQRRNTTRAFDNCFENYDGDAVAAALVKRAEKNDRLSRNLFSYINRETAMEAYEKYKGRKMAQVSRELIAAAKSKNA